MEEKDSCGFGLLAHLDGRKSHWLLATAIEALANLTHRGAMAADGKTGDGCGVMFTLDEPFFRTLAKDAGISVKGRFAVGMVFFPQEEVRAQKCRNAIEEASKQAGLEFLGYRHVPVQTDALGESARRNTPFISQVFLGGTDDRAPDAFERRLYVARRLAERALADEPAFHVASLSSRTITYKGLMLPAHLQDFYPDLSRPELSVNLAIFHQRFSTNTLPDWRLCQPFRMLAHNGEINTIAGNRAWAMARAPKLASTLFPEVAKVAPWKELSGSDSASLDAMLEGLVMSGMGLFEALRLLIPPAWQNVERMDDDLRAFYEFHALLMEPWDGPAGIVLTDGRFAACALDRNGLRPARYWITRDQVLTVCSESGVWGYSPADVVKKSRLAPGEVIAADLETGEFLSSETLDARLKAQHPYRQWLNSHVKRVSGKLEENGAPLLRPDKEAWQKAFGVSREEKEEVIRVLAAQGQEAVGSMGDDTPMAVLSREIRSPYDYLRQQFAQVTNPPIDPIREACVMSLTTYFGREKSPYAPGAGHARRLEMRSPVLSRANFQLLEEEGVPEGGTATFFLSFDPQRTSLKEAIGKLAEEVRQEVARGAGLIILSDEHLVAKRLPIPALFAVGAVHEALVQAGLRTDTNLVAATATARDPHHFACLIGVGASAVYPWLAYEIVAELHEEGKLGGSSYALAEKNYREGIQKGLLKIISKMGISALQSYRGAKLFEAVGISREVAEVCFPGMPMRLGGADFADFEEDLGKLVAHALDYAAPLWIGGLLRQVHGSEQHAFSPDVVLALRKAAMTGERADFERFSRLVNERPAMHLRDLLEIKPQKNPIALDEVEPVESIVRRFDSAAMSLGALSPEAHETLAVAMNRLGGRSNSGEGGEDPLRFGTEKNSKIKQVASGRFGVTPAYLASAEVIQIKISQGAKPGEGGQLPGDKVTPLIARLRFAKPGIPLISPPPHHDIYSIEDLAQLIFDLKQVNPRALVSVKLVSEPGVGTVAAGVVKAYADLITISGYDGGTGASPLTSVKYAGSPWELGLAEAQGVLVANGLRERVRIQVDGGLKTGLDVIKAALLGAESFGFGTAPMVAMGCKYLRICHLNNCATGVATQEEKLRREYFHGAADQVIHYFLFVASEVRQWLARLGARSLDEIVGRAELLEVRQGETRKQKKIFLENVLALAREKPLAGVGENTLRHSTWMKNPPFDTAAFQRRVLEDVLLALEKEDSVCLAYPIRNIHRSAATMLAGEIAHRFGAKGLAPGAITLRFLGTAGQSFGAFNAPGMTLVLEGDANDYVGKGMAGGEIVIHPPQNAGYVAHESVILGNTALYGATGGRLFASGLAGERFAVRNSGAMAVVEGVGDHGCEYMTGGCVVVLGPTGLNFGAGMTGGFAFVYDEDGHFVDRYNHELIDIHHIHTEAREEWSDYLKKILLEHIARTGSQKANKLLAGFETEKKNFWLIKPKAARLEDLLKD